MSLPPLPPTNTVPSNYYTEDQIREYGQACREAALEDAAQICRLLADCEENTTDYRNGAAWCAEKIRSIE